MGGKVGWEPVEVEVGGAVVVAFQPYHSFLQPSLVTVSGSLRVGGDDQVAQPSPDLARGLLPRLLQDQIRDLLGGGRFDSSQTVDDHFRFGQIDHPRS